MPPKRQLETAVTEENKKFRSAIESVADDWLCPITCELPVEPMMAEDGHVYERAAIEEHIRRQREAGSLKSPMTNIEMGPQLLKSVQAKNTIEKLVRTGAIRGDKANTWLQRIKNEEEVEKAKAKAQAGDGQALFDLGHWHSTGKKGLPHDLPTAHRYYMLGSDAGNASAMANAGWDLASGKGVEKNETYGVGLIFRAAEMGSDRAASDLADFFYEGTHGLPQDSRQARYWYAKVATAAYKILKPRFVDEAADRVRELDGAAAGAPVARGPSGAAPGYPIPATR